MANGSGPSHALGNLEKSYFKASLIIPQILNDETLMGLCSCSSSLWVKWCHSNILKGECFWELKLPSDCSWTWRDLLKLRDEAIKISKYIVGNGESISLWHSNCYPQGPLMPKYGARVAYDAGLPKEAKVSKVIVNGQWKWPYPCTWELREIINGNPLNYMPNSQLADRFVWTATKNGEYHTAATWEAIRVKALQVNWHTLLWFPLHIPRHSFIVWLAIRGRLNTKDWLLA